MTLPTSLLDYDGWATKISSAGFVITPSVQADCLAHVASACALAAHEDTAVWKQFGQPSLLARVDATLIGPGLETLTLASPTGAYFDDPGGSIAAYEVEMRPAAVGISTRLSSDFASRLEAVQKRWPNLRAAVSSNRSAHDDAAWLGLGNITQGANVPDDGSLVIVRAEPDETSFHHLAQRSASLLHTKGDRTYGEQLGWWQWVTSPDQFPSSGAFVLKPRASSKARHILICRPSNKGSKPGMLSRNKTIERFQDIAGVNGGMFLQPYYPPMRLESEFMILRIIYAFDPTTNTWTCLGGVWNLLSNVIVHGTERTTFGPLVLG